MRDWEKYQTCATTRLMRLPRKMVKKKEEANQAAEMQTRAEAEWQSADGLSIEEWVGTANTSDGGADDDEMEIILPSETKDVEDVDRLAKVRMKGTDSWEEQKRHAAQTTLPYKKMMKQLKNFSTEFCEQKSSSN
eukprot:gene7848-2775_t